MRGLAVRSATSRRLLSVTGRSTGHDRVEEPDRAITLGFVRDRTAAFFTILFR
jgi:hypothetical protein